MKLNRKKLNKLAKNIKDLGIQSGRVLKKSSQKSLENIQDFSRKTASTIGESIQSTSDEARLIQAKLQIYLTSDEFESDLDDMIRLLHIHDPSKKPNFDKYESRLERIIAKTQYIKKQALLFVSACGAKGFTLGTIAGLPNEGFIMGTAFGTFVVVAYAGKIVLERLSTEPDPLLT